MPNLAPQIVYNMAFFYAQQYKSIGADAKSMATYLTAIAKKESEFKIDAKNKDSSARGLMQMLNCTQRAVEQRMKIPFAPMNGVCKTLKKGVNVNLVLDKIINNPDYAMMLAANELAYQFKRYGNWGAALHAYNQGNYKSSNSSGESYKNKVLSIASNYSNLKPSNDMANVLYLNDGTNFYKYEVFI